ncbi:MAG: hypothetical protein JWN25_3110 [Verrucomicrobiales bacterium]|nr:hypothetical protein [Verrucomicrobiales bacterium]
MKPQVFSLFICLLLGFCSGCSTFDRDFKAARASNTIEGPWTGTWKSESSGHTDKLRCIVKAVAPGAYEAKFKAKYHTILSFGYVAHLKGTNQGTVFNFKGKADLGKLAGGVYSYDGNISPGHFHSIYTSKYDHGTFDLHRSGD